MPSRIKIQDTNMIPGLLTKLKSMRSRRVEVGFLGEDGDLAVIARAHEFGTISKKGNEHIPERSFLRTAFDDKKNERMVMNTVKEFFTIGSDVMQIMEAMGLSMKAAVQRKIKSNIKPPNDPRTLKKKRSRRTLIDTSRMVNAVDFEVK